MSKTSPKTAAQRIRQVQPERRLLGGLEQQHRAVNDYAVPLKDGASGPVAPLSCRRLGNYRIRTSSVREFDAFVLKAPFVAATLQ